MRMPFRRLGALSLASTIGLAGGIALAGLVATAPPAFAAAADVKINEVDIANDVVELLNTGTTAVDVSGFVVKDDKDERVLALPAGTILQPGAFTSVATNDAVHGAAAYGLGKADAARLFDTDGTTLLDTFSWTTDVVTSYGRCADGTGAFVETARVTPDAANACTADVTTAVKVNEVESSAGTGPDWVELRNLAAVPADISGLVLRDSDDANTWTVPAGTTIPGRGHLVVEQTAFVFGLGGADAVRLLTPDASTVIDRYDWTSHAVTTHGRCPDGTGPFTTTATPTQGAANDCAPPPTAGTVVINEVESNGDDFDWVELKNTGSTAVDLSGWTFRDNDPARTPYTLPTGASIAAGGYFVLEGESSSNAQKFPFGLGAADSAVLRDGTGTTVAEYSWTAHSAVTYGRCPDGTGALTTTTTSTRGAANDCSSPVRINEVESQDGTPGDWVELTNIGAAAIDLTGFVLTDSNPANRYAIPATTSLAPGAFLVLDESAFVFGLGRADTVTVLSPAGAVVDTYSWTEHAPTTYGRSPDGTGAFTTTLAPTKGAANLIPGVAPVLPWPGGPDVRTLDAPGTFSGDLSGLDYEPSGSAAPGTLWAVQNGDGLLYRIVSDGRGGWAPDTTGGWAAGKTLRYPGGGTATVDAEGVTVVADSARGGVYVSSERSGAANGVSRPSVLRYDVTGTGTELVATTEWNLAADFPGLGANAGLEGITWVPDAFLVASGFIDDRTGAAYDPAAYAGHGGGLFFIGVEGTASVYAYALATDGSATRIATIPTTFALVADVQFDADLAALWVVCDEACGGRTAPYALVDGAFTELFQLEPPANSDPGLANEGFAVAPEVTCVDGSRATFYADDNDTDGFSLRTGTLECVTAPPVDPGAPTGPTTGGPGTPVANGPGVVAPRPGPTSGSGGRLAQTGAELDVAALIAAGALLLGAGAGTAVVLRRRRTA